MPTSHHAQLVMHRSRGRSGISPIVAGLILVAIAIILVASLSGFASSVLGTYSYSALISVESLEIQEDGTGKIVFYNGGAKSDSVVALQVIPNSPMDLVPSTIDNNDSTDGSDLDEGEVDDNDNDNNSNPGPKCKEHSDEANCMHDQDRGQSGSSSGHQNTPDGGTSNNGNTGSNTNNSGGQGNGPNGNNGHHRDSDGMLLPPYAETEISWAETSVGEFSTGDMITVQIYLESGNRLTYSTLVS